MASTDANEYDPLSETIHFRLTESERDALERLAVLEDRPLSWLVRKAVRQLLAGATRRGRI